MRTKSIPQMFLCWLGAVVILGMSPCTRTARAECRPYIFGMGHYLASWANQPWSYDADAMDRMVEMGATAVWVDFPWSSMESSAGTIDWSYADHQVEIAEARGLELFAFVGTTPDWAKLYPDLPGHRTPPAEEFVDEFTSFHTALAARYAGRVTYYQFWNEPSGCGWIGDCGENGDCELFTLWQQRAYLALKAGNPNCVVSAGGFDGDPAGYVQCMYDHGGGAYFDAISIHPYGPGGAGGPGTTGEGIDYSDLTTVRGVMLDHGDVHKKIWITEYGWNTTDENQKADDLLEVLTEMKKTEYDYVFYVKYLVLNNWTSFCCYGLTDPWFVGGAAYDAFKNLDKSFPDEVDFWSTPRVGDSPLEVSFVDASCVSGEAARLWEFGDGETSTQQNPTHIYASDGLYTVRLTITGDAGSFTEEKAAYVRVGVISEIQNPSYEDPFGFLNGWSSCLSGESSIKHNPGTHVPVPQFHDGENSAGMSSGRVGDNLGPGAIWQAVPVHPGHTYRVQCWGAITASDGDYVDDFLQLRIRDGDDAPLNCLDGGGNLVGGSDLYAHLPGQAYSAWTLLQGDVTPSESMMTVIAYWEFAGTGWVVSSLHLDDWSLTDITPHAPADFDADYDVDISDYGIWQACATGPEAGQVAEGCGIADLDGDEDVDQADFGLFQRCFTGPGVLAAADCTQ